MDLATYRIYYENYKKWCHVDPKASITPSRAQLSVLDAILKGGSCYVDLALWGSYTRIVPHGLCGAKV